MFGDIPRRTRPIGVLSLGYIPIDLCQPPSQRGLISRHDGRRAAVDPAAGRGTDPIERAGRGGGRHFVQVRISRPGFGLGPL